MASDKSTHRDEHAIEAAFASAVAGHVIRPAFQPVVHLDSGAISALEALARWTDPDLGSISPSVFIPIAERSGLIADLTGQLIRSACSSAQAWNGSFRLALNISPLHFQDGEMPGLLEGAVAEANFPLSRIDIEITETAVFEDIDAARATIDLLRAKGVRILLDDFGTGYSSLTRLQSLPFDQIKIDWSFVQGLRECRENRKIVGSVIGLAQSLGIPVVAEGVEDEAQADILRRMKCDFAQGWLFGRPVFSDQVPALLSGRSQNAAGNVSFKPSASQQLAHLDGIYASAPVGLCFVDRDLRILSANDRYAALMGTQTRGCIGLPLGQIDRAAVEHAQVFADALKGKQTTARLWPLVDRSQTGLLTVVPACDECGDVVGLSLVVATTPTGEES